ncbi:phosphotransferase [Nonomuraea rubra]|uniref:protein kinase domain-containing protein n=1 Tax=Nonomuraea rubra TaxID=46180 RepID=UPI00362373C6
MQEFIDGTPLQRRLVHRYPLTRATCTERDLAEYTEWAVETLEEVARAVGSLHERGVVFGDLHPDNILLTDEGRVALIDYEVATLAEDRARAALAHPAFAAPADRQGVDVDRYALACLRLGLFAPQCTIMLPLHRPKVTHLGEIVKETFPVPHGVIDEAVATIAGGERATAATSMPGVASWPELRDAMATAIVAAATPARDDRLFPGDVGQFQPGGGLNLAHGAAGVLFALHSTGLGPFPEYERWLRERARRPVQGSGLGLYDGLHGIAYVLGLLGHQEDAHDLVEVCLREKWDRLESALISGLSGIGLNLLHFGRTDLALRAADICAERLGTPCQRSAAAPARAPGSCTAPRAPRCCSCTPTSTPATRRCSTWPPPRSGRTCGAAATPKTARSRSTRGGGCCRTSTRGPRGSPSCWSATCGTGTTRRSRRRWPSCGSPGARASSCRPGCSPAAPGSSPPARGTCPNW